jgi:hypothetical protein
MRRNQLRKVATVDSRQSVWLQAIKARTGISEAEQIRRGIELWVESFQGFVEEPGDFASDPTPVGEGELRE